MPYSRSFLGAVVAGLIIHGEQAIANPSHDTASYDSASISMQATDSNHLAIHQSANASPTGHNSAIIDWAHYNLSSNDHVDYTAATSTGTYSILNRIYDTGGSTINGHITSSSNQTLYFVNTSGIVIGSGATFNVGSMLVSGLNISNADFMAGNYNFFTPIGETPGRVINNGTITAATGGFVVMMGGYVKNTGHINAAEGHVHLVGGEATTVTFEEDGLIEIEITKELSQKIDSDTSAVSNTGEIYANGGIVSLSAKTASDVFTLAVNNTGVIEAHAIANSNGHISLLAEGGDVLAAGTLDVSGEGDSEAGQLTISSDKTTHVGVNGATSQFTINAKDSNSHLTIDGEQIVVDGATNISLNGAGGSSTLSLNADNGIHIRKNLDVNAELTLNSDVDDDGAGALSVDSIAHVNTDNHMLTIKVSDIHLNGLLNSGTADTVFNVSHATSLGIGQSNGSFTLDNNELSRITAANLSINGLSSTSNMNINGVNSGAVANIAGIVSLYGNHLEFSGHDSTFKALEAAADSGITLAKSITTTQGHLHLDADVDYNQGADDNLNVTHDVTLTSASEMILNFNQMTGGDALSIVALDVLFQVHPQSPEVDPTPIDPTPVDPTPVDPTPVDPTPVDPTPVDSTPVDPTPVDPTPVDPTPVDPTPVDPTPVDPTPVDPAPVDPTSVDPIPGIPTSVITDDVVATIELTSDQIVAIDASEQAGAEETSAHFTLTEPAPGTTEEPFTSGREPIPHALVLTTPTVDLLLDPAVLTPTVTTPIIPTPLIVALDEVVHGQFFQLELSQLAHEAQAFVMGITNS